MALERFARCWPSACSVGLVDSAEFQATATTQSWAWCQEGGRVDKVEEAAGAVKEKSKEKEKKRREKKSKERKE